MGQNKQQEYWRTHRPMLGETPQVRPHKHKLNQIFGRYGNSACKRV
jgi:hypothetical protein